MDLRIVNQNTFATIGMLSSYISCIWKVSFSDFGDFELVVPFSDDNYNLLREGRIIYRAEDVYDDNGTSKVRNAMFIESIETTYNPDMGWIMTVRGRDVKSLLCRRIVWDLRNFEDELFGGVIYYLVDENFTNPEIENRTISGINLPQIIIGGPFITAQLHGENIGEWIVEQAKANKFGWRMDISGIDEGNGPSYHISFPEGEDRTNSIIFSPEYGNLLSATFTTSLETFKNVALVGGEGSGSAQIQTAVSVGNKVGLNRYEIWVQGQSRSTDSGTIPLATYKKMLQQFGMSELIKYTDTMTFDCELDVEGVFKINEDYFLGDRVSVSLSPSLTGVAVLSDILYSHDATGMVTRGTFIDWEVQNGD